MGLQTEQQLEKSLAYLAARQCPQPWRALLAAVGKEFRERLPLEDLRLLMSRVGAQMALALPLRPCASIAELERAINARWLEAGWGWVELDEQAESLILRHFRAPVAAVLGDEESLWVPALLEGLYSEWFRFLGADDVLKVSRVVSGTVTPGLLEFRLGR